MNPSPKKPSAKKCKAAKKTIKKIDCTVENIGIIGDLSRAVGLVQAVQDTTKGERRATVLQEAIDLISKYLP